MRTPFYERDGITLYCGDSLEVAPELDAESVSAVVTDPPYGLGFMGKAWDHSVPGVPFWQAFMHAMKPGAHLLAFGGSRTYHRMGVAIEDAGLELRDTLMWLYGSGFPKSHDVSKAIDKVNGDGNRAYKFTAWMRTTGLTSSRINEITGTFMGGHYLTAKSQPAVATRDHFEKMRPYITVDIPAWVEELIDRVEAEREVIGKSAHKSGIGNAAAGHYTVGGTKAEHVDITAPATPEAAQWAGWGTALKPSFEPVILARKRLSGTVAANVLAHGTGALNIDACRIGTTGARNNGRKSSADYNGDVQKYGDYGATERVDYNMGRWPSNVILDEDAAAALDRQSGERPTGALKPYRQANRDSYSGSMPEMRHVEHGASTGGASRFFKTVKHEENDRTYADFMVQYDCNCEAVEGDQWVKQDRNPSIQQDADTPPQRDTTATPSGTASEGVPCLHTSSSGSGTTGQSLTDTRCITSTVTSRTTGSKTCNCSTPQHTSASIQDANCATANGGNPASSAASSSESTPNIGTSAKRDGRSTDGADNAISAKSLPINSGNAARFRYVAKASRAERRRGVPDHIEANHPTVKPLALMRHLVTLVTPPGGIVLDPFAGSGSTLVACAELGVPAIGIELSEEYCEIIARRVDHALNERAGRLPLDMAAD